MKFKFFFCIAMLYACAANAQHTFTALVTTESGQPLSGTTATISGSAISAIADQEGIISFSGLAAATFEIRFTHVGYEPKILTVQIPQPGPAPLRVILYPEAHEEDEIIIMSTRSSRTIANIPTRIETVSGEELMEKANMKPGEIRMLLSESTGIQTQQTSATSYNSSIRIQGLDGKYTQIIRDGFPLYSGFSGGLGLLQIAPLDLKQVEIIKGSASTLYGGGAIAGLVNLISKTPREERELDFLINGTTALGMDASGFYSQQFGKFGTTLFASYNHGTAYDPANIGFTAIPEFDRYVFNPRIFYDFSDRTKMSFGFNATIEDRVGGDINYIRHKNRPAYFEKNSTNRYSTQFSLTHQLHQQGKFTLKNSVGYYDRSIEIPGYLFAGLQLSSYTELDYSHDTGDMEWIGGITITTDNFDHRHADTVVSLGYREHTFGLFLQNTWKASQAFTFETGLRVDYDDQYGTFVLPRLSVLYRPAHSWTIRAGGGLGYKTPNVFTEDAERIQFKNVLPIAGGTTAERSYGANIDVNFKTKLFDEISLSVNNLFFYTRVNNPIVLTPVANNFYGFKQPPGFIDTRGIETNIKFGYEDFALFIGYTFSDVNQHYQQVSPFPLVARHRLNNVLMYEVEDQWKIGLEAYYYSPQLLNDGRHGRSYWLAGFMAEKIWESLSLFINFENLFDVRQTKFDRIYDGTMLHPVFRDIYAPVDGFVMNGGVKIHL